MKFVFNILILLSFTILISYCTSKKNEINEVNNYSASLETRSNVNLRQAIVNVFSDTIILNYIYNKCVTGDSEVVSVAEIPFSTSHLADFDTITSAGISEFYFPFIEMNFNYRTNMRIINLDSQTDSTHIYDLNGTSNNRNSLEGNLTIMFKTTSHTYDAIAGGSWRPWRRCYCVTVAHPDGGTSSQSTCSTTDINVGNAGMCGRTGFFNQDCSGAPCGF